MSFPVSVVTLMLMLTLGNDSEMTSYSWRLDLDLGKVRPENTFPQPPANTKKEAENDLNKLEEKVLSILLLSSTASSNSEDGSWKRTELDSCPHCYNNRGVKLRSDVGDLDGGPETDLLLDCGRPVNFTHYDQLMGLQNRGKHPNIVESDVLELFSGLFPHRKPSSLTVQLVEKKLRKEKREKPKSVELYNQMGNFWRLKGDTQRAVECFRRALAVSPNNVEVLLNMAKVLFKLNYLEDAVFLTRRSLEVQPPDQNAWRQHWQLGEILKAYSHYQEAALHLRHVLELRPNFEPALKALSDMEVVPDAKVNLYTFGVIFMLMIGVVIYTMNNQELLGAFGFGEEKSKKKVVKCTKKT